MSLKSKIEQQVMDNQRSSEKGLDLETDMHKIWYDEDQQLIKELQDEGERERPMSMFKSMHPFERYVDFFEKEIDDLSIQYLEDVTTTDDIEKLRALATVLIDELEDYRQFVDEYKEEHCVKD
jgi:hypothetical protein